MASRSFRALALSTCGLIGAAAIQQAPPAFRAQTSVVSVDVSVRAGNAPVEGLDAADFELLDNGVPQRLMSATRGTIPTDVSIVVDTSHNAFDSLDRYRADVLEISRLLGRTDQLRILAFGASVEEVQPMRSASLPPRVDDLGTSWLMSVNDAVLTALLKPAVPNRRHLVVAFTSGTDSASVITGKTLSEVARRADAVLHVVLRKWSPSGQILLAPHPQPIFSDGEDVRAALTSAAENSGGAVHSGSTSVAGSFRDVFDRFRQSYVLTYQPANVTVTGWHDIQVRIKRPGQFQVEARKGYHGG